MGINIVLSEEDALVVLNRLRLVTEDGKLTWQVVGNSEFMFFARTENWAYRVSSRDKDDVAPFVLQIIRIPDDATANGQIVQTISSDEFGGPMNPALKTLYESVKRQVLGVEEIAPSILADLDTVERGLGDRQ